MQFPNITTADRLAYDTETTGLNFPTDRVFGFSITLPDRTSYYYDIREYPKAVDWLNDSLGGTKPPLVICHNASFDYRMSAVSGIKLPIHRLRDTVIRACSIDEHLPTYGLDYLAKKYVNIGKDETIYQALADIFGGLATRNVQMKNLPRAPSSLVGKYANQDTLATLLLFDWQEHEIIRQELHDIIDFETSLMPTFIRAEMRGIHVNEAAADEAISKLTVRINEAQAKINKIAGWNVNVNSSPQVKKLLAPRQDTDGTWFVGEVPIPSTDKGGPSLGAETLRMLAGEDVDLILNIRSLIKTRDTFLGGHVLGHAVDGKVYPNINQSKGEDGGTGTGRLSYTNPAMQQIPSRNKEVAAIVKPVFLPPPGMVWVDADMASFEVRVFAHLVNNPTIVEAYKSNPDTDFHQFVADLTGLVRNATYNGQPNAKQLNLSMIFNSGDGAIAEKMGMPWHWDSFENRDGETITYKKPGPEAAEVIAKYHRKVPGVKDLMNKAKQKALTRGYVFTSRGRHLRFPGGFKAYKASGLLIQATAADLNKENWQIIEEELDGVGHLILNTHDSYSMALPEDWQPHFERVKQRVEERGRLRVPLLLDLSGSGSNWWEAVR